MDYSVSDKGWCKKQLYLMRHGEIEPTASSAAYGQTDVDLSARGREQSRRLSEILAPAPLVAVYSSDLKRAMYAADLIARVHGLKVVSLPALREIHMGEWEGRSLREIAAIRPEMVAQLFQDPGRFCYPGGESFAEFERRVRNALRMILAAHESGAVAVVTHGGVCRLIIGSALELAPKNWLRLAQDFGCLNIIEWYGDAPLIRKLNHTAIEF
jgi:alpha-ribazole phosphatase